MTSFLRSLRLFMRSEANQFDLTWSCQQPIHIFTSMFNNLLYFSHFLWNLDSWPDHGICFIETKHVNWVFWKFVRLSSVGLGLTHTPSVILQSTTRGNQAAAYGQWQVIKEDEEPLLNLQLPSDSSNYEVGLVRFEVITRPKLV